MKPRTRLNWKRIIWTLAVILATALTVTFLIRDQRIREIEALTTPPPVTWAPTPSPEPTPTPEPTPEPTESPVPTVYPTIRKGDKGDIVMILQERLINLGYLSGRADGDFGSRTQQALRDYQVVQGLAEDGIAGPRTMIHLFDGTSIPQSKVYYMKGDTVYHTKSYCPLIRDPEEMLLSEAVRLNMTECIECH